MKVRAIGNLMIRIVVMGFERGSISSVVEQEECLAETVYLLLCMGAFTVYSEVSLVAQPRIRKSLIM